MQRPQDVPFDHLGAVAQDHQRRDGAETTGLQVDGRTVVYLAVDDRVHQSHDLGRQLGHGRRRDRVVAGTVVTLPEIDGGLVQVFDRVVTAVGRYFFDVIFGAHDISMKWCGAELT